MRIVLFGAGASYGSGEVEPKPPPLGNQLFDVLRGLYSGWRSVPESLASLFRQNFERGMEKLTEDHGFAIAPLMQEMAIFFSIFALPKSANNRYVDLLKADLKRREIIWSTLNYECLLEMSASAIGHPVVYFKDPSPSEVGACIWKLHGSCNFTVANLNASRGVLFSQGITFEGGINPVQPQEVRSVFRGNTGLYPAMALYAKGKTISMSPAPIRDAQTRWNQHVLAAEKILLIGIAPNLEDSHIWDSLTKTNAAIGFVGSEAAFKSWTINSSAGKRILLGKYWSDAARETVHFLTD